MSIRVLQKSNIIHLRPRTSTSIPSTKSKIRRVQASDPVRDLKDNERIKAALLSSGRHGHRNWMIWVLGTNDGERASDYLTLRICDVWDGHSVKEIVPIRQQKTSNSSEIILSAPIREALEEYILSLGFAHPDSYLFPSQKAQTTKREKQYYPNGIPVRDNNGIFVYKTVKYDNEPYLQTKSYGAILKKIQKDLGLPYRLGTHSMRKTAGLHTYYKAKSDMDCPYEPLEVVRNKLGHSTTRNTMQYIGLDRDFKVRMANELVL